MEKITASIVVYNNKSDELTRAIESFLESNLKGLLTVIDNSPTDKLKAVCNAHGLTYIFKGQNLGYGKAHNLAMRDSLGKSRYHLVMNPDVYFKPDVIGKIVEFMDRNTQAGLAMPKVFGADGQLQMLCKLLPTPIDLATRRFLSFEKWFKARNDQYELRDSGYDRVMNVPFLSGCFMLFRTEALSKVGLFDERFFLYAEDTDLSRRMHQQFETLFFPEAEINHVHARGSYKDWRLTIHNTKSAFQYFNKWGWFFDEERTAINQRALLQIKPGKVVSETLRIKAA